MDKTILAFALGIALSLITVLADTMIKHASLQHALSGWNWIILGAAIYAMTAFGWFYVIRDIKLSTAGALYAVSCVVSLTLLSVFYFNENISLPEVFGIAMAIVSLVLLARFA